MTAEMAHEPTCDEEQALLESFLTMDTPEGFRAELIEGEIVVSPPPGGDHERVISRVSWQCATKSAVRMDFSGNKGLKLERGELCVKNLVVPDGVFAPQDLDLFGGADSWMPSDGVAMVVEVTSTKPDRDRGLKRHCYAKAGISLYLLVDRAERTVSLFGVPDQAAEDYREDVRVSFGKPLDLPQPFGFTLETTEFR